MILTLGQRINEQRIRLHDKGQLSQQYLDCKKIATEQARIEGLDNFQMRHILLALRELNIGGSKVILNERLRQSRLADEGLTLYEYLKKYYRAGSAAGPNEYPALKVFENVTTSQEIAFNFFSVVEEYRTSPAIHPLAYLFRFIDSPPEVITPSIVSTKRIHVPVDSTADPEFKNPRFWAIVEMKAGLLQGD